MKKFHEENPLPLTFEYIERFKKEKVSDGVCYLKCKKYQTNKLVRKAPVKYLTRLT